MPAEGAELDEVEAFAFVSYESCGEGKESTVTMSGENKASSTPEDCWKSDAGGLVTAASGSSSSSESHKQIVGTFAAREAKG